MSLVCVRLRNIVKNEQIMIRRLEILYNTSYINYIEISDTVAIKLLTNNSDGS